MKWICKPISNVLLGYEKFTHKKIATCALSSIKLNIVL